MSESCESIKITFKTVDDESYDVTVNQNSKISQIEEMASSMTSIPLNEVRFIYRGRHLEPEKMISDYGIEDGSTLYLVPRRSNASNNESDQNIWQGTPIQLAGGGTGHIVVGQLNMPQVILFKYFIFRVEIK